MKKYTILAPKRVILFSAFALSIVLSGCVGGGNTNVTPSTESQLNDLRKIQADQTTTLSDIRADIRDIFGRIEEIEHRNSQLLSQIDDVSKIEARLPPAEGVPVLELNSEKIRAESSGDNDMLSAIAEIRKGDFKKAIPILESSIRNNGARANYLFWLGVANENHGFLEKALGAYHESTTNFPKDPLAPAALMRQADVFLKLGDKGSTKLTLEKLISSYPNSGYTSIAKTKLKTL